LTATDLLPVAHSRRPVVVVEADDTHADKAGDLVGFVGLQLFVDLATSGETECGVHLHYLFIRIF
jgi:hypothetical protein